MLKFEKNGLKTKGFTMTTELFSLACEKEFISGMMQNPNYFCYGIENLTEKELYFSEYRILFTGFKEMYKDDMNPTLEKLIIKLKALGSLEALGGIQGVVALISDSRQCKEDAEDYVKIIKDFSARRDIIAASEKAKLEAYRLETPIQELLTTTRDSFYKISDPDNGSLGIEVREHHIEKGDSILRERQRRFLAGEPIVNPGLETGFRDLDKMVGGLKGGNLVIITARTGVGKTSLALNMATNMTRAGNPIYFFSMEMSEAEVLERINTSVSGVPVKKLRDGTLTIEEREKIFSIVAKTTNGKFILSDRTGIKLSEIISRCIRAKEQHNISAVFIDYLQLLYGDDKFALRQLELSDITRRLKILAKKLGIPVICLAQLNRKAEERPGHRPELSDLRESGSIEQDADLVFGILRKDVYDKFDKPGEATIIVMKNRSGPTCDVNVLFDGETSLFKDRPVQTFDVGKF